MAIRNNGERAPRLRTFGPAGLRRRSELMDAAVRLAARRGFSRTRVSDIVGHVGVGQGVFYWYFESKDALFGEILGDGRRRLRHYQGAFVKGEPDPVKRIAKGVIASVDFVAHNRHVYAFLDHAARQTGYRPDREAGRVHVVDVARHIEDAIAQGLVRETDPQYLALAVTGVVERLTWMTFATQGGANAAVDRVAQEAVDFVLGGLAGGSTYPVAGLRDEVALTPELLDIRDRIGALGPDPVPVEPNGHRTSAAPRRA